MTQVKQLLIKTLGMLTPPGSWTQNAVARDKLGKVVDAASPKAVSRCLFGAIVACDKGHLLYKQAMDYLETLLDCNPIIWQDEPGRTHEEVVSVLTEATK